MSEADYLQQDWPTIKHQWLRAWTRADRAESTWHKYVLDVQSYLDWCREGGHNSISLHSADEFVYHCESRGKYAGRNTARAIKALGKFLNDIYDEDPYKRLKVPVPPAPTKTPTATEDDLQALLRTCDDTWQGQRDRCIILTLARTGMRRSEVANMAPEHLDLASGHLSIPKTKTHQPRSVWLPDELVKALLRYRKVAPTTDVMWPSGTGNGGTSGKPVTAPGIGQMLKRREKEAGLNLGAHAWRRKFAGDWIKKEGTEVGLMAYAGWSSTAMIARYSKNVAQQNAMEEAQRLMG